MVRSGEGAGTCLVGEYVDAGLAGSRAISYCISADEQIDANICDSLWSVGVVVLDADSVGMYGG